MATENPSEKQKIIRVVISISILNLIIYLVTQAFFSYGIYRDELYYLACANRLDFGYVDQPPLSIAILTLWKFLFRDSMFVVRIVPALVSSATVFMIGLFTIRLGGGKTAVIISTIAFMLSPIFLGMNTIYSMNAFDFFFWITSAYIFLRIIEQRESRLWIVLGIVLGLGLLNKTSIFWLGAGIFAGIIFSPMRKELKTKYPYIAAAISLIIFTPYIIWNITHDLAHFEFMRNASALKYEGLTPLTFMHDQVLSLNPLSILIWLPGIIFFFISKAGRKFGAVGFIWLTTFVILFINWHTKGDYIAPAYQVLFAGGAVMIERWSGAPKRNWVKYSLAVPVIVFGIVLVPFARPLLSPEDFIEYQSAMGMEPPNSEGKQLAGLPQFYSDMFGWEELAQDVSKVYQSLSEEERKTTVIYCSNYGKAGAIEYYSNKYSLPKVICPHNNFWYWWDEAGDPTTLIIIGGEVEDHLEFFEQVEAVGMHNTKYAMPYENKLTIFIGRGLKISIEEIRQSDKIFV